MAKTRDSQCESECAADYAQAQKCFHDYQGAPYRFHDQIAGLQKTVHRAEPDGFVHQPGLCAARLSFPEIDLRLEAPEDELGCSYLPPVDPPVSLIDLAAFRILIDVNRDQGLKFSTASSRWQKLALRELDRETIDVSEAARQLVRDVDDKDLVQKTGWLREDALGLRTRPRAYAEPVSPLLSPTSSLDEPFIPDPGVAIIDLTSEPSSPTYSPIEKLQKDLQDGRLDSEPTAPSVTSRPSSPLKSLICSGPPICKPSSFKVDVPLVISSPSQREESDFFINSLGLNEINTEEMEPQHAAAEGFFDEAMEDITKPCHERAVRSAEEEQLDRTDSFLRMQVPALDFEHPEPEWSNYLSDSQAQFEWMSSEYSHAFLLAPTRSLAQVASSLKWTPIPPGSDRVSVNEALETPGTASRQYLGLEASCIDSGCYFSSPSGLTILRILDDEEIEPDTSHTDDLSIVPNTTPEYTSETLEVSEHQNNLDGPWGSLRPASSRLSRRKASEDSSDLLPHSGDSSATSKLLSSFIQLRRPNKKLKLTERPSVRSTQSGNRIVSKVPPSARVEQQSRPETNPDLQNAPVPEFHIPSEKCRYVVSTSVNRTVLSRIEKAWPEMELVDKDFSQYNEFQWSPGSTKRQKATSPLSFEADITLSPSVGIILTTLLKVKQKPLPGSNSPTPFRNRIKRVSEKYESLFILVSEANPQGEYVGTPSASDRAAYADFVRFTTALQAGVTAELVHGAEESLSKWILALMARFFLQSSPFSHLIDARDTTWGLFFRRAGFNVVASQVLESMLVAGREYRNMDE
ncbi:hypothetical protein AK830_g6542 [Neonectria ditissima]|uniref:DUF7102 domain-containing protein n=1 Tax=Neonectria ditissima TaxID=78410 RepID=A0A0P7BIA9_9HYPO|nr:hypothetical protein AK830_g6542 [Neonectria ditissima]